MTKPIPCVLVLALLAHGCGSDFSGPAAADEPAPRAERLLLLRDGDIHTIDPDGGGLTPLTDTEDPESSPVFSPDGRQVAFVRTREVFLMNADGTGEVNLSEHPADDRDPVFSPDGRHVAFVSDRDGNDEVYVVAADGSGLRNLTNHADQDTQPAFSPDGDLVAFASERDGQVHLVPAAGGETRRLTGCGKCADPVFSPGGDRVAVSHLGEEGVWVFDLEGRLVGTSVPLAGDQSAGVKAFTPDGGRIVYAARDHDDEPPNTNLHRMAADATALERLTPGATEEFGPVMSPDGRRIAFTRARTETGADPEVVVMDLDGSSATTVTSGTVADWR
jgi:Tol biopolymer transport system component